MNDFNLLKVLFFFVWACFHSNYIKCMETCTTPESESGVCTTARDCTYFVNLVYEKSLSTKRKEYLRQFYCGFEGENPIVCCPRTDLYSRFSTKQDTSNEICYTPDGLKGECIIVHNCSNIIELVQEKAHAKEEIEYLERFQCGFENTTPKVCCPLERTENISAHSNKHLLPSSGVCGKQFNNRIIGGTQTDIGEYPWMALLIYNTSKGIQFLCGGSLINNRYVLTAAHCVVLHYQTTKLIGVRLGEHDLDKERDCSEDRPGFEDCSDDPIDISIERIIPHEQYNSKSRNYPHDIALVRLDQEVAYTDYVRPICLPLDETKTPPGTILTVAGWGITENHTRSNVKLAVDVSLLSDQECLFIYLNRTRVRLTAGHICAGGTKGKDSCKGDSGGPLMLADQKFSWGTYIAVGIVSFGVGCGNGDFPGVYTRIASYTQWILDHIEK